MLDKSHSSRVDIIKRRANKTCCFLALSNTSKFERVYRLGQNNLNEIISEKNVEPQSASVVGVFGVRIDKLDVEIYYATIAHAYFTCGRKSHVCT